MNRGFVKLYRKLADNPLWNKKPFSDGQAWVDLLLIANHKPGIIDKRGNRVKVDRGQVGVSVKGLSDRWGWSQGKVNRFLKFLENEDQIVTQKSNVTTLITLTNFETYATTESKTESRRRTDGEQAETNKKGKKEPKPFVHKNDLEKRFDIWWEAFNDKRSRKEALSVFIKINPGKEIFALMIEGAKVYAKARPALKAKGGTPKMAQGWLNGARWEDETGSTLETQSERLARFSN